MDYSQVPLPDTKMEESRPFWEGAKKQKLVFPCCISCGKFHWYPLRRCPHCQSTELEWVEVNGPGRVFTWVIVRHPFLQAYESWLPYMVALVEFDDAPGIRLVSNIIECKPEEMQAGLPVQVVFQEVTGEVTLPVFKPANKR
ncbi:MAG: Zn-ribbon domain-containing OB-fold protein [Dehalococcoidia bacterium]